MQNSLFLPRGIRNRNPGNIRHGLARWQGMADDQPDQAFVAFDTAVYGLRALMKLLLTYYHKYDLDTVQAVINRWAPPHENATDHYVHHLSRHMGVGRYQALDMTDVNVLICLAQGIVRHENGRAPKGYPDFWYDDAAYQQAARLAVKMS